MHGDEVPGAEGTRKPKLLERMKLRLKAVKLDRQRTGKALATAGACIALGVLGFTSALCFVRWPLQTALTAGGLIGAGVALQKSGKVEEACAEVAEAAAA